jgi:uncharacterized membrane protein YvbJ
MQFCSKCGAQLPDDARFCTKCGNSITSEPASFNNTGAPQEKPPSFNQAPGQNQSFNQNQQFNQNQAFNQNQGNQNPNSVYIDNHLVKAILVTIFCCIPLGIVSIIYSSQVNEKKARGDFQGATEASRQADLWSNWAIGAGIVVMIIAFLVGLAG